MAEGAPTKRKAKYAIEHGEVVGEGSYRIVYRTRRGRWVYKLNTTTQRIGSNNTEWRTYLRFKSANDLPEGVKIPEMHLLSGGIIAAEYINGTHPDNECYKDWHYEETCPGVSKCWAEKVKNVQISDLHFENVLITPDGTIYLIDLGHGES